MKRLIITTCIILIAAAGMAGAGCQGGTGAIEFGDVDTAADAGGASDIADTSGGADMAAPVDPCDPIVITNTVIEVVGGDEDLPGEPEGQTCLMSRVPDNVGVVVSILKDAQSIVAAMQDALPQASQEITEEELAEKKDVLGQFMMPFDELGLEEVVGFAKFKYVDGVMKKPDDACRQCIDTNVPACLVAARTECETYDPPPGDLDRCAWERVVEGSIVPACDDWSTKCYDKCSEEKPEPESFGILVRWLSSDGDVDGTQKFADLKEFVDGVNKDNFERAVKKWNERCYDENGYLTCNPSDTVPTELEADEKMEIEQIDSTVALVHSALARPNIIEPVRICSFIRFDTIQTRPPVYAELSDLRLIIKLKPGDTFPVAARDSRKLVAGIDLKDNFYRLYAGVVDKDSLATGAYLSSVINLGDDFGMGLWMQLIQGLVTNK